ncbi:DUF4262 domain-containing protein [Pseudoalteromonas sp. SG44-8]|uniref:DUF4262 domain-containing protein n=1 Tax=Pseudoalteromonas sp. SG44-8 TaxID=2760958 RepID=UPI0016022676|nr:DUF4262 domain-containing protein [Pseudoalteromonas sp. SG44-8]MBB1400090.1 DUF4262 domain-containing protein [Pseudoalteromonas sp. SG44-8]
MNETEKEIVRIIEKYGCYVTSVFDPDGESPNFTYSTGITDTYGAPELIIIGLNTDLAQSIVNNYAGRLKNGEEFTIGEFYEGFLEGFDVTFSGVSLKNKKEYMLSACWYNADEFEALQLVYPTTSGVWPWDADASESFLSIQPSLATNSAW